MVQYLLIFFIWNILKLMDPGSWCLSYTENSGSFKQQYFSFICSSVVLLGDMDLADKQEKQNR